MPKNLSKIIRLRIDPEIIIKRERLAERCEVCHQTDCFDPINNSCSRCKVIIEPLKQNKLLEYTFNGIYEGFVTGVVMSFIAAILLGDNPLPAWAFLMLTNILISYVNAKFIKLAKEEKMLTNTNIFITCFVCVIIGTTIACIMGMGICFLIALALARSFMEIEGAILTGVIIGIIIGIFTSLFNSMGLIGKRNKEFLAHTNKEFIRSK